MTRTTIFVLNPEAHKTNMTMTKPVVVMTSLMLLWASCEADFTLTLMHTNDIHARFEQFSKYGSSCSPGQSSQGKCFGGYARLKTAVDRVRNQYQNALFLDAGDQYQGTLYFYRHAGNIVHVFMNWVGYDAMALGNHEFDRGVEGALPLLQNAFFDVLSSNIDAREEPSVQGLFQNSTVFNVGGHRVGVIGYTTTDTPQISDPGRLEFSDVVTSVTQEVRRLTSEGVKVTIALGHAGFTVDKEVARIPGVDVVIGGHTNTFLYTGQAPSNEVPAGQYPTAVTRDDGSSSVVAQCYTWAKYLCVLHLTFSEDEGRLLSWHGNPQLLDSSVPEDAVTWAKLQPWKEAVDSLAHEVVGETRVKLEGDRKVCRTQECNLGNLITDSMIGQNRDHPDEAQWKDVNIALTNGGNIRATVDIELQTTRRKSLQRRLDIGLKRIHVRGDITIGDVLTVLPFRNSIDVFKIRGRYLKETFEYCASRLDPCNPDNLFGGYLQVSGLRVTYDLTQPVGQRVASLEAVCSDCQVARWELVDDDEEYKMMVPSYIAGGGDGYDVLKNHAEQIYPIGDVDSEMLVEYVKKKTPITQGLEGRIRYINNSNNCNTIR